MTQDAYLIALRIKGFAKPEVLAECLSVTTAIAEAEIAKLVDADLAASTKIGTKLTPNGQVAADKASEDERSARDPDKISAAYDAFCELNTPFKTLIAEWQSRDGVPNDHSDPAYGAALISRLKDIHLDAVSLTNGLATLAPRMAQYASRLNAALRRINLGEQRYVAAPIIDSYHTIWFELHEDLIRFSGKTRAEEALAGRAV